MPNWKEIHEEVKSAGGVHDVIRRKYIKDLADFTGRNVIVYYSGWLQKGDMVGPGFNGFAVHDADKNGFMSVIHQLDRSKGLDLVLHTPGGSVAATESLVYYLRQMFGNDIRAIVPQLAMSAGTMISLSCKEVVMGKHSSLGPIDPQFNGIPAHGVIEEFNRARTEIAADPSTAYIWQPILGQYPPTFVGECQKAISWSKSMVQDWLETGMFAANRTRRAKATKIVDELADHIVTLSHGRQYSADAAKKLGIKIVMLEKDDDFQDKVLTVHHACIQTLAATPAFKIIENQNGVAFMQMLQPMIG